MEDTNSSQFEKTWGKKGVLLQVLPRTFFFCVYVYETTAVLDIGADEWIINTPTVLSQKYWITNGAIHAQ
jgi:hypothetical protein